MTISAISIYVSDLPAASRFYIDVLGFRVAESYGDYATKLEGDGPTLLLCAGGVPTGREARYPSGVVLGHRTLDLERRVAELRSKGVDFVQKVPETFPAGRYLAFVDPFGIGHELLEYTSQPRDEA
jgi:catechol 2,3-dioxygenase-like lactoylglutathione lyase family enzyme